MAEKTRAALRAPRRSRMRVFKPRGRGKRKDGRMKKTVSLNQNHIFRRLYRVGTCQVSPYLAVYVKKSKGRVNRLGITASKKIGGAVCRNRARRLIKEAYRLLEPGLAVGYDIVIVARKRAVYAKMQDIQKSLRELLRQMNVIT